MKGQCLCGKTRFSVELENRHVHVCHCSMCRRQSSGVLMTVDVKQGSLQFQNDENLAIYDSSAWGERGFCKACGTSLFWRTKDHAYTNVNVFAFEQPLNDLTLDLEIYIDHKPDFYAFQNQTKQLTEADVIALFNSNNE